MLDEIYLDDLAQPVLSELQKSALAYGESLTVNFNREEILQEAKDNTGMCDFGAVRTFDRFPVKAEAI